MILQQKNLRISQNLHNSPLYKPNDSLSPRLADIPTKNKK